MAFSLAFTQALYVVILLRDKVTLHHWEFVPAGVIAESLGLPKPSVVKILGCLSRAGIVVTGTGVAGGARLAEGAEDRSLDDLFRAMEGHLPLFRADHVIPAQGTRPDKARAAVGSLLARLERTWHEELGSIRLGDWAP